MAEAAEAPSLALTFNSTISKFQQKECLFYVNIEEAIGLILTADGWLWPVGCVSGVICVRGEQGDHYSSSAAAGGPASRNTASPQSHSKLARVAPVSKN